MTFWLVVISIVISLNSSFNLQGAFDSYRETFTPTIYTNEVIELKERKQFVDRFGYIYFSPYEFLSDTSFYENFSNAFFNATTAGTTYSMPYAATGLRYNDSWPFLDTYNISTTYDNSNVVYTLSFVLREYNSFGTFAPNVNQIWDFYINDDQTNYYSIEIAYSITSTYPNPSPSNMFINLVTRSTAFAYQFIIPNSASYWWYDYFISDEYQSGYDAGYYTAYDEGYNAGVERGEEIASDPASDIYENIYTSGYNEGFQIGRAEGVADASASAGVPALIFTGILNVALLPVDIFLQMFQYEVFGINIAGLISGLLTVCMVIIIIRFLFGGKGGSKDD